MRRIDASTNGSTSAGKIVLRHRSARPRIDVQHLEARLDQHGRRLRTVLGPRVDVALDAGARERARRVPGRRRSSRRRHRSRAGRAATCASRTRRSGGRTSAGSYRTPGKPRSRGSGPGRRGRSAGFGAAGHVLGLEGPVDLDERLLLAVVDRGIRGDRADRVGVRGLAGRCLVEDPRPDVQVSAEIRRPRAMDCRISADGLRSPRSIWLRYGFEMPASSLSLRNESRALRRWSRMNPPRSCSRVSSDSNDSGISPSPRPAGPRSRARSCRSLRESRCAGRRARARTRADARSSTPARRRATTGDARAWCRRRAPRGRRASGARDRARRAAGRGCR